MELQWKPPVSTVTRPKRRAAANIYETDIEKHKEFILDLASQGTYQSTIETFRNEHNFEISIDHLKNFLKIWGFQKKPRRNPPTGYPTDLIAMPTPNINRQTSKILEPRNPLPMVSSTTSGVSGLFSSFAVASLPKIMSNSAHERQRTVSWVVRYQPGALPQSNAKKFTNEPPKLLDDDIDSLIRSIERLELNNFDVFAEGNIRGILPRLAQSIEVEPELETQEFSRPIAYERASDDFRKLLKYLRDISTLGVDTEGLRLIKSSSTRDLEHGITSITWTNKLTKLLLHSQTKKIKGRTAMVNIKKMHFRSLGGETFEVTDTNIILWPKRDQSHPRLGDSRVLSILCRSTEQYTPGLSVSLGLCRAIESLNGIDNILKAALRGDLEEIQQRCSKGEWSLRSCDQMGFPTLHYAILRAFVSEAPLGREKCMRIMKLIVTEAPDMFLEGDGQDRSTALVLHNDVGCMAIDDELVENFIGHGRGISMSPDGFSSFIKKEEFSEKLSILVEKLSKEENTRPKLHYLLQLGNDVPSDAVVKSLKVTIDVIGDIYNPMTSNWSDPPLKKDYSPDFGVLFCPIAHFSGNHGQWYAALADCRYKFTRFQAQESEARYLNASLGQYRRLLEELEREGFSRTAYGE
ncbi:hypothetical protein EYR41_008745 [Orbilia oligospora]|uniref:Clr5 domain-containing protein n=1 Tax=Orbilia oligospora TaxID=2813651 RepID=A0A7C8TW62_ORBOL|nr:hypothetical protein TWF751_002309 [Orbilia oligospora]TGJ67171.1 hypothetical protein EYR41_008745 [Orbilia oligospora]